MPSSPLAVPLVIALAGGLRATPLLAQTASSSVVVGTVRDATGAVLAGTTISASSPNLIGGARSANTDPGGFYRFAGLPSGMYEVAAARQGFKTARRRDLWVSSSSTLTVDFDLELSAVDETIEVTGAPLIDLRTSAAPTNLDADLLHHLPTNREFWQLINLVPGVRADIGFGQAQGANTFRLEGVNASDPSSGGISLPISYNWIQDVQVVAAGAPAEHGEFSGVLATTTLRSGSNRYSGLAEYRTSGQRWIDSNTSSLSMSLQRQFRRRELLDWWDSSAQVGGPIVRDQLWFFSGLGYERHVDRAVGSVDDPYAASFPKFLTKLTSALATAVRVDGFFERDVYNSPPQSGPTLQPEAASIERIPNTTWHGQVIWTLDDRTVLAIRHGGTTGRYSYEPVPPNTRGGPAPHVDSLTGVRSVNASFFYSYETTAITSAATLTRYADRFFGWSHEFRLGAEHERTFVTDHFGYPGGRLYLDYDGQPDLVELYEGTRYNPTTQRTTLYAQDAWMVHDRITVNPGIRLTLNRGSVPVRGQVFSTTPVSPRIGFAWDLAADHRTVVRGHYGRYHDALLTGQFGFMDTTADTAAVLARVLGPDQFEEISRSKPLTSFGIDENVHHPFVDQYVLGVERQLPGDVSLQVQYLGRSFNEILGFIDTRSIYVPVERRDPGPDGRVGTADDGALITLFDKTNPGQEFWQLTTPDAAFRRYRAFQVIGRRRYSRTWQMLASYTWSRTTGNVNNRRFSNTARFDTGQNGAFANPNAAIKAAGPTAFDYTHEVKVSGTYRLPRWGGLNVSGVYRYQSGLAWGRTASFGGLTQGRETIRIEPRATRRLPAMNTLDLRVEKTFHFGETARSLGLFVDVFNAGNQGVPNSNVLNAVVEASGPNFGVPAAWIAPRTAWAGVRFMF